MYVQGFAKFKMYIIFSRIKPKNNNNNNSTYTNTMRSKEDKTICNRL